MTSKTDLFPKRYTRNHEALSVEEGELLQQKKVAVVGCGGLGCYNIEFLARIGIGHLVIIDGDVYGETNLNRQLFCTERTLGEPKAQVAANRVLEINSSLEVSPKVAFLNEDNAAELLAGSDCIIDALDSVNARLTLAHAAAQLNIPLIYGSLAGWYGQVAVALPGSGFYSSIYDGVKMNPEEEIQSEPLDHVLGCLPFTCACVASHQSCQAVKLLLGKEDIIDNTIFMIDMLYDSCETMN